MQDTFSLSVYAQFVFSAKQLKNLADKVCFNNHFEPYFELVITKTHKTN